jgi:DNA replication licensing factor MCM5
MSGFDANNVYTVSVHDTPSATSPDSPSETEKLLLEFLLHYRVGGEFIYRLVMVRLQSQILYLNHI